MRVKLTESEQRLASLALFGFCADARFVPLIMAETRRLADKLQIRDRFEAHLTRSGARELLNRRGTPPTGSTEVTP